ncbi:MAG: hypothetical protein KKI12_14280, partial [Proteobacteria bacterium]|nr:hypothetical protein [Pseudomonadota bacterium]
LALRSIAGRSVCKERDMHGILSLVKNLLCACPSQIPRYSGLEYQSYYFALLKKLSNTCPLKLLVHRGGAKLEL